jgi:hypothetical protein
MSNNKEPIDWIGVIVFFLINFLLYYVLKG